MKKLFALHVCLCLALLLGLGLAPAAAEPNVPVGTVITYYGTVAPDGYFVCNGASFSSSTFPKLRAVLGSNILPDLRGYFVRGYDTRNTVDTEGAGRVIGSVQGDAIRNIRGTLYSEGWWTQNSAFLVPGGGSFYWDTTKRHCTTRDPNYINEDSTGNSYTDIFFDASRVVPTAAENRPKNKTLLSCIKHDEPETPPVPEKASIAETVTGTDDAKYVTPAGVAAAIAAQPAPQPTLPDLRLGVETKWPLLYQGKQVYAKLINFGQLPANGMRMVTHGITDIEWCQVSWDYSTVRKAGDSQLVTLGMVSTAPPAYGIHWRIFVNANSVQAHPLSTTNSNADWSAVVCILYTKTTDQPVNP